MLDLNVEIFLPIIYGETAWNANPSLRAEATELADKLKADFDADVERRRRNSY